MWAALQLDILNWVSDPGIPPPSQRRSAASRDQDGDIGGDGAEEEGSSGGGGGGGGDGGGAATSSDVNPDMIDPNDQVLTLNLRIDTAPLFVAAWPDDTTTTGFVMETAAVSVSQFSTRIDDGHIPRCSGAPLCVRMKPGEGVT